MTPDDVARVLRDSLPTLFECSSAPHGAVRVLMPLTYPDGDFIEVFVVERDGAFLVTDHGDSLGWLRLQSVSEDLTTNQRDTIEDICKGLGVRHQHGQLALHCEGLATLADAIHRLGQAALRIADIQLTFRPQQVRTVGDQVDHWLRSQPQGFTVDRHVKRVGETHTWTLDYEVSLQDRTSLVFLLTPSDPSGEWRRSEHVFTGFSDLKLQMPDVSPTSFVSLFDDTEGPWRDEIVRLVQRVSTPVKWSERDELARVLSNAAMPLNS